ncbi:MAG: preprotein translocase subunit SecA [Bacilli bacterium]|jgi:preprotein translocase subunit SecA|nr:preprotein translocase subunit SecA [Bacilli bacterium]MDD2681689.1 preprotein translocase subunit SecA [Bacilli bacterium]MDD3121560.1 preprotein translocase subunit SecA [Bacilli bacterium]MDD4062831.1 preprotein translocase subunit SecA [Bacilli bacterium]MDD4482214.1 preprotein translocase subunit SecA [Bacilli bacterium]
MFRSLTDPGYKELKRVEKLANKVVALQDQYKEMTDEQLKHNTVIFRERIENGESLSDIAIDAFATVREAGTRVLGLTAFKVQVMGAFAMHGGNIAEMKTGEGKTLTSTLVAYLNALSKKGVHIVTVNEYLAARDAREMGELFTWLGLTVGLNLRGLSPEEKREAYNADITYSTNSELGFDYLRDHMVIYKEHMVQKELNFCIIDEVDSILIDEARTPLIISGGAKNTGNLYQQADLFAKGLRETDYEIDIKSRHVTLNEDGMEKAERFFGLDNLYDIKYVSLLHHIHNALRANYSMAKDIDYVVQEGKVIIVDPFTGRLMHGRQYSEGLHQALEAKERVEIKKETKTVATITYQNFFRMYKKLAGMTGTAKTEEEEFRNIYNMYVVEIPTNEPIIRQDEPDLIFITKMAKFNAIAEDIKERYQRGQPVLVGTIAIETSELLSELLRKRGVPHSVLNAKQHEREAEIVANAGKMKSVTIATNMAGRGTDIKLGPGVVELGGLAVIGTERHESRRIDNQLRGRSGRQGDPGYTRFYLSTDDDLMQRFGTERFKTMLSYVVSDKEGNEEALESKMFSKFVENAQKRIEGQNFDSRKQVLEYDEVLRAQREIIYEQRNQVLFYDDISEVVLKKIENVGRKIALNFSKSDKKNADVDEKAFYNELSSVYFPKDYLNIDDFQNLNYESAVNLFVNKCNELLNEKKEQFPENLFKEFLKVIFLRVIDTYWMDHIDAMSELRQAVSLQAYAQVNPLREYKEVGFQTFEEMINGIENDTIKFMNRAQIRGNLEREQVIKPIAASAGKEDSNRKKTPAKSQKIGRNDPCPCGSGKKYKNCHGK